MAGDRNSNAGNGSPTTHPGESQLAHSYSHGDADNTVAVESTNDAVTSISAEEDNEAREVSEVENAEPQDEMLGMNFYPLTLNQLSKSPTGNVLDSPLFYEYDTDEQEAELAARRARIIQAVANARDSGRDNEQDQMSKTERDGLRDLIIEARSHSDEEIDDLLKALFPTKEETEQAQAYQASFTSRFSDDTESTVNDNEELKSEAAEDKVAETLTTHQQAEIMHPNFQVDSKVMTAPHSSREHATVSGPLNVYEAAEASAGNTEDTDDKGGQKIWKRLKSLTLSAEEQALEKEKLEKKRRAEKLGESHVKSIRILY